MSVLPFNNKPPPFAVLLSGEATLPNITNLSSTWIWSALIELILPVTFKFPDILTFWLKLPSSDTFNVLAFTSPLAGLFNVKVPSTIKSPFTRVVFPLVPIPIGALTLLPISILVWASIFIVLVASISNVVQFKLVAEAFDTPILIPLVPSKAIIPVVSISIPLVPASI